MSVCLLVYEKQLTKLTCNESWDFRLLRMLLRSLWKCKSGASLWYEFGNERAFCTWRWILALSVDSLPTCSSINYWSQLCCERCWRDLPIFLATQRIWEHDEQNSFRYLVCLYHAQHRKKLQKNLRLVSPIAIFPATNVLIHTSVLCNDSAVFDFHNNWFSYQTLLLNMFSYGKRRYRWGQRERWALRYKFRHGNQEVIIRERWRRRWVKVVQGGNVSLMS